MQPQVLYFTLISSDIDLRIMSRLRNRMPLTILDDAEFPQLQGLFVFRVMRLRPLNNASCRLSYSTDHIKLRATLSIMCF